MDIYREIILDHYKNPRNFGHLDKPDAKVEEGNITCGDRIVIELKVKSLPAGKAGQKSKVIEDIRFSGEGCAISQAVASMLTERVKGIKIDDVMKLKGDDIITMLGTTLTPSRTRCATLSLAVLTKALCQVVEFRHA